MDVRNQGLGGHALDIHCMLLAPLPPKTDGRAPYTIWECTLKEAVNCATSSDYCVASEYFYTKTLEARFGLVSSATSIVKEGATCWALGVKDT